VPAEAAGRIVCRPLDKPVHTEEIDRALQARVSARKIPGVVAMAANGSGLSMKGCSAFAT
jgi:methyl acetate hydrolase